MDCSEDRIATLRCNDGVGRAIHIWGPEQPRAVMLAIHGGLSHPGDFVAPALYFRQSGRVTVSLELRGHERKRRVFIDSFDAFLDDIVLLVEWVKSHYPGLPIIIMAHSMGALIATHFGLRNSAPDPIIKGFVMSSPYFGNALAMPKAATLALGLLSLLAPKMKLPLEDFTPLLTHDRELTERIRLERATAIRASEITARFANELRKAQQYLPGNISRWSQPLLVLLAGQDHLADNAVARDTIGKIDPALVELHYYPDNYHDNFNETNRAEIFATVESWLAGSLGM